MLATGFTPKAVSSFLQRVGNLLYGGPWRLELQRGQTGFALAAYRGQKLVPFAEFLEKRPALRPLTALVSSGETPRVLYSAFTKIRQFFKDVAASGVQIELGPEAETFEVMSPPPGFHVSYHWVG